MPVYTCENVNANILDVHDFSVLKPSKENDFVFIL